MSAELDAALGRIDHILTLPPIATRNGEASVVLDADLRLVLEAARRRYTEEDVERATKALQNAWRNMHTNEVGGYQRMLARAVIAALGGDDE